ncbi:MAG TPA: hypothetical protein VG408_10680 [Actinomycetota bacterium]|nr:hypothetical protein [Actinomycetota bacterium]
MTSSDVAIGTTSGLYRFHSDQPLAFAGTEVNALARDADGPLAIVDGHDVYRGRDDDWEFVEHSDLRMNCLARFGGDVFAGTEDAHVVRIGYGVVAGFDKAETRDEWFTPWGGPPDVRSFATTATTIYANVHVGGILASNDGESWHATIDLASDVHEVSAPADDLLLAATAWGLATSTDGGRSWTFEDEGLHASYARAVCLAGDVIVMSASEGPRGRRSALYRKLVGDGAFERCRDGLPEWFTNNVNTGCLAARDGIVYAGTEDGSLFVSYDAAATWEQAASDLGAVRWIVAS